MSTLTIAEGDRLDLSEDAILFVNTLENFGEITGSGTIWTDCRQLIQNGTLAETVKIRCAADSFFIDAFASAEPVYDYNPSHLAAASVALSIPMARRDLND